MRVEQSSFQWSGEGCWFGVHIQRERRCMLLSQHRLPCGSATLEAIRSIRTKPLAHPRLIEKHSKSGAALRFHNLAPNARD